MDKKLLLIVLCLCFFTALTMAQSKPHKDQESAVKETTKTLLEIGTLHAKNNSSSDETKMEDESILSLLNKTISEVHDRAEKQYDRNRYIIIKDDD